jgi:Putative transposase
VIENNCFVKWIRSQSRERSPIERAAFKTNTDLTRNFCAAVLGIYVAVATVFGLLRSKRAGDPTDHRRRPRHLGAEIGFFAVLHTWGQNLIPHPHLHCVVPGGGLSADGRRWIACRPGFFLPVRVLSRFFRRRFLELLEQAYGCDELQFFSSLEELRERNAFRRRPVGAS